MQSGSSGTMGSLRTVTTGMSEETNEAIAKGHKNAAHFRGTLCWTKDHFVSIVITGDKEDRQQMNTVGIPLRPLKWCIHAICDS